MSSCPPTPLLCRPARKDAPPVHTSLSRGPRRTLYNAPAVFTIRFLQALRWSGLSLWGALLLSLLGGAPRLDLRLLLLTLTPGTAYLISFWRATDSTSSAALRRRWSLGLSASALVLCGVFPSHPLVGALLVAVAGVLPMHLSPGPALAWLGAQAAALFVVLSPSLGTTDAVGDALWALGMQGGLALMMFLVFQHLQVRREWLNLASHLTRQVREAERVRIARDLHDLLGHDLALLGAELEYARTFQDHEAQAAVGRARTIVSRLFTDVRGTVGSLRSAPCGWSEVLRALDVSVPGLRLHLALPPSTPAPGAGAQGALAMVVQEALTNTVRHAGATNFFVEVRQEEAALVLSLWDDGQARGPVLPGHGLRGMRERLEEVGGSLRVSTLGPGNVHVQASVPLEQPA